MLDIIQELDIFELRTEETALDPVKVDAIKISIEEKGLICPIAVNEKNEVVAGNHRLAAYKKLYSEHGENAYRHIQVRVVTPENDTEAHYLETTEKLFHPQLSVLEKLNQFQSYFEELKYGEKKHKTTTIFKTLDISRRTFFNLRAIAERMTVSVRERIQKAGLQKLAHSTPELLALCKLEEHEQHQVLDILEQDKSLSVFEAIRKINREETESAPEKSSIARRFLKSPVNKLEKDLKEQLKTLSQNSGVGQNELFNEIFAAGLEIIQQKYS